jgi:ferredoxin
MKVWIDDDLCTGDGLCCEIAPAVFEMQDDGLAYVKQNGIVLPAHDLADVPTELEEDVIESALYCPGECIFIEDDERAPYKPRR